MGRQVTAAEAPCILVTDDNVDWVEVLTLFLRRKGYRALAASSATEALETLDTAPGIEVVISDVRMPEIDGFDFFRVMRHRYPSLQVILVTGHDITDEDIVPHGATILRKPLDLEQLLALLPAPTSAS
jgi:DNA-binding NtrC family response regulator